VPGLVAVGAVCSLAHFEHPMPKRSHSSGDGSASKRRKTADAVETYMKGVDRAVARYGASAVGKYYSPRPYKAELKYFDVSLGKTSGQTLDWNGNILPAIKYMSADGSTTAAYTDGALIPSAVGNGYGQVVGNKYIIRKLKVRGIVIPDPQTATTSCGVPVTCRIMLVQDTQPNGAQISAASFMTDWGFSYDNVNGYMSISSGAGGRIRILGDKTMILDPAVAVNNASATTVSNTWNGRTFSFTKVWKKGLPVLIKSGGSTPAVSQLSDMNIFLVYCVTQGNAATTVQITCCSRCSYYD